MEITIKLKVGKREFTTYEEYESATFSDAEIDFLNDAFMDYASDCMNAIVNGETAADDDIAPFDTELFTYAYTTLVTEFDCYYDRQVLCVDLEKSFEYVNYIFKDSKRPDRFYSILAGNNPYGYDFDPWGGFQLVKPVEKTVLDWEIV